MQEPRSQHSLACLQSLRDSTEATPCPGDFCTFYEFVLYYALFLSLLSLNELVLTFILQFFIAPGPLHWSKPTHHSESFCSSSKISGACNQPVWEWGSYLSNGMLFLFNICKTYTKFVGCWEGCWSVLLGQRNWRAFWRSTAWHTNSSVSLWRWTASLPCSARPTTTCLPHMAG